MSRKLILASSLLFVAASASAEPFECEHKAPHRLTANVGDARSVVIIARSGTLKVTGANTNTVTASGTACASDRDFLPGMRLEARREGTELRIEAIIPEHKSIFGWHQARLDFEVTVPANLPVRIKDGSGAVTVRDVASLDIVDGSGELNIRGIRGDVDVVDGSGSLTIADVGGDVRLRDGSGSVEIDQVGGSVNIREDGSGSIDVADIRGDFTVKHDGSGGVSHNRVSGRVSVPQRD